MVVVVAGDLGLVGGKLMCGDAEVGEGTGGGRAHKLVGFIERFKGASEKAECY